MQKVNMKAIAQYIGVLIISIVIFGIFLTIQGINAADVYANMIISTLWTSYGIGEVIIKSTPLILIAVATCISSKAGLVNVGGEGQFAIGALFSTMIAIFGLQNVPGFIGIIIMALAGIIGGMLWSGFAGIMKVKANMNETITTVILNYIAYEVVSYFVFGILKDPKSANWPMSPKIPQQLKLPIITGKLSIGIVVALIIAIITWIIITKSKWGYKLRVIGGNPIAALHAGYNVGKTQLTAIIISGGLAGLAGMIEIAGVEERLRQTTGVNYGYFGFLAAWMAWNNPLLAVVTAVIIGFLSVSGNVLEISSGLPSSSIRILMAIVLLAILWKGKGNRK